MVYLREIIHNLRNDLLKGKDLTSLAYLFASEVSTVDDFSNNLSGEEEIALKGYLGKTCTEAEIQSTLSKKPYKGFGISDNIYKLIGINFASDGQLIDKVEQKFNSSSLKTKYFISKCLPEFKTRFESLLSSDPSEDSVTNIIRIISKLPVEETIQEDMVHNFIQEAKDVIDLLLLEDLERHYLSQSITKATFLNKNAKTIIIEILSNFREATKKVTQDRRKDHGKYQIRDEYDVQDLLYVIVKTIFPKLREEDPTPKVGSKSNRIDLILREEGILIEVKMIKEGDTNETKFVEELKTDIQSYHQCQWLQYLICFVYDPFDKTRSKQHFYDLNGNQSINGKSFEITVIIG